jgi:uncharacterized protein YjaZ
MKPINILIILLSVFLITGCQVKVPDFERTTFKINNQQFEILTANNILDNFIISGKNYGTNFTKSSDKLIYNAIEKEITKNAEASFLFKTVKIPYEPNDLLKNEIELLKSEELVNILKNSLTKISSSLPGPDTKIIVLPASPFLRQNFEKMGACINGITIGTGKIILMIDPTSGNWKETLPYVIAHEYHHSTWISRNWISSDFSLLEFLIFEGRADMFASELYQDVEVPWTKNLTEAQEKHVWSIIKNEIFEKGHSRINEVMYGTDDIPFGSGYTIGYNIVRSFKKNNQNYSDLDIIDMNPKKIFELSGYE